MLWYLRFRADSVHRGSICWAVDEDDEVMLNAEAWFSKSLRPRKPEGSLGRTAQDGHLDSHTAPELCGRWKADMCPKTVNTVIVFAVPELIAGTGRGWRGVAIPLNSVGRMAKYDLSSPVDSARSVACRFSTSSWVTPLALLSAARFQLV